MKPSHDFEAERALARHCEQLLAPARTPDERGEAVQSLAGALCRALPDRLQSLLLGKKVSAKLADSDKRTASSMMQAIGREAANYLIAPSGDLPALLVTFDLPTGIALTDRLFGGDGKLEGEVPANLPMSASLALERVAEAVGGAFGVAASVPASPLSIQRQSDIHRLAPFPRGDYCMVLTIEVEQENAEAWSMQIALLENELQRLAKSNTSGRTGSDGPGLEDSGCSAPFGAIPLTLRAILAEMQLPLAQLATLAPGDIIPMAPARQIPLRIGPKQIGHGTIGTLDECVALRLTKLN